MNRYTNIRVSVAKFSTSINEKMQFIRLHLFAFLLAQSISLRIVKNKNVTLCSPIRYNLFIILKVFGLYFLK